MLRHRLGCGFRDPGPGAGQILVVLERGGGRCEKDGPASDDDRMDGCLYHAALDPCEESSSERKRTV